MVSAAGSDLPEVLSGRVCAYCFEKGSALVVLGCVQECIYDYVFCASHVLVYCAQLHQDALNALPCGHAPCDLIYSYPGDRDGKVFNSDGVSV